MNPVYAGLTVALTFAGLIWFIISGQPAHLTVTFVLVTLGLGLGASYIMSREQANEAYADGEDYEDEGAAANDAMSPNQIPEPREDVETDK